ncbi:MAG: hypothetical protein ACO1O3_18770 [Sphingobium sp.]|jgi:hypothetical protein
MRDMISKLMTGSAVAGAALLVAACGSSQPAENNTTANVEEMNAEDAMMDGTTNDMMTNTDAAMGNAENMAADNAVDANATSSAS